MLQYEADSLQYESEWQHRVERQKRSSVWMSKENHLDAGLGDLGKDVYPECHP